MVNPVVHHMYGPSLFFLGRDQVIYLFLLFLQNKNKNTSYYSFDRQMLIVSYQFLLWILNLGSFFFKYILKTWLMNILIGYKYKFNYFYKQQESHINNNKLKI